MKIGRNEPCPCGSGIKFKKCCKDPAKFKPATPERAKKVTLTAEVEKLVAQATTNEASVRTMGVFIFVATDNGDGWLFEMSDLDGLKVAENGQALDFDIIENSETIEVNWSHSFAIKKKKFFVTSYKDKLVSELTNLPTHAIFSAIKRIRKKFPKDLLASIHIDSDE